MGFNDKPKPKPVPIVKPAAPRFVKQDGVQIERDGGVPMSERILIIGTTGKLSRELPGELPNDPKRAVIV